MLDQNHLIFTNQLAASMNALPHTQNQPQTHSHSEDIADLLL